MSEECRADYRGILEARLRGPRELTAASLRFVQDQARGRPWGLLSPCRDELTLADNRRRVERLSQQAHSAELGLLPLAGRWQAAGGAERELGGERWLALLGASSGQLRRWGREYAQPCWLCVDAEGLAVVERADGEQLRLGPLEPDAVSRALADARSAARYELELRPHSMATALMEQTLPSWSGV